MWVILCPFDQALLSTKMGGIWGLATGPSPEPKGKVPLFPTSNIASVSETNTEQNLHGKEK